MGFNPNDYENVKSRKIRFFQRFPDARIVPVLMTVDVSKAILVKASVFKNVDDQKNDLPLAVGHAYEIRGEGFVNKTSWVENCEESAVGRALDNAGFASNMKCSREEMEKAERMEKVNEIDHDTNSKAAKSTPKTILTPDPIDHIQSELKRLTDDFKDTNSLIDIYKTLGVENYNQIQGSTVETHKMVLEQLKGMD